MTVDPNKQYLWWMILCASFGLLMFIFHAIKLLQYDGFTKSMRLSSILSLSLIIFGIIGVTVFITTIHAIPDHIFCIFAAHWGPTGYSIFKFILYSILILRFMKTFKNSLVVYNKKKLYIWVVILLIWTSANLVAINLIAKNIPGTCQVAKPPLPMIASIALLGMYYVPLVHSNPFWKWIIYGYYI